MDYFKRDNWELNAIESPLDLMVNRESHLFNSMMYIIGDYVITNFNDRLKLSPGKFVYTKGSVLYWSPYVTSNYNYSFGKIAVVKNKSIILSYPENIDVLLDCINKGIELPILFESLNTGSGEYDPIKVWYTITAYNTSTQEATLKLKDGCNDSIVITSLLSSGMRVREGGNWGIPLTRFKSMIVDLNLNYTSRTEIENLLSDVNLQIVDEETNLDLDKLATTDDGDEDQLSFRLKELRAWREVYKNDALLWDALHATPKDNELIKALSLRRIELLEATKIKMTTRDILNKLLKSVFIVETGCIHMYINQAAPNTSTTTSLSNPVNCTISGKNDNFGKNNFTVRNSNSTSLSKPAEVIISAREILNLGDSIRNYNLTLSISVNKVHIDDFFNHYAHTRNVFDWGCEAIPLTTDSNHANYGKFRIKMNYTSPNSVGVISYGFNLIAKKIKS